jgi:hypothetical protein
MAIRLPPRLALRAGATFALVLMVCLLVLFRVTGSKDPQGCLERTLHGEDLTEFARTLESAKGVVGATQGFSCRGLVGMFQSEETRGVLGGRLTQTLIARPEFRRGLYQAHVARVLPKQIQHPAIRAMLNSLDELAQDRKAAALCPSTGDAKLSDYEGLDAPLISAMLVRSAIPQREDDARNLALDLSNVLALAERLPGFPRSACPLAPRYFSTLNSFLQGTHPLAQDCRPQMDGTDLLLHCQVEKR